MNERDSVFLARLDRHPAIKAIQAELEAEHRSRCAELERQIAAQDAALGTLLAEPELEAARAARDRAHAELQRAQERLQALTDEHISRRAAITRRRREFFNQLRSLRWNKEVEEARMRAAREPAAVS